MIAHFCIPHKHTQIATAMHSGEGELVVFSGDCLCDGPVEVWLQNVVDSMKLAMMDEFRVVSCCVCACGYGCGCVC